MLAEVRAHLPTLHLAPATAYY
eukprot:COSAG06_NODE_33215_length_493_cov_1.177665_1_plen_21_part_10